MVAATGRDRAQARHRDAALARRRTSGRAGGRDVQGPASVDVRHEAAASDAWRCRYKTINARAVVADVIAW